MGLCNGRSSRRWSFPAVTQAVTLSTNPEVGVLRPTHSPKARSAVMDPSFRSKLRLTPRGFGASTWLTCRDHASTKAHSKASHVCLRRSEILVFRGQNGQPNSNTVVEESPFCDKTLGFLHTHASTKVRPQEVASTPQTTKSLGLLSRLKITPA